MRDPLQQYDPDQIKEAGCFASVLTLVVMLLMLAASCWVRAWR